MLNLKSLITPSAMLAAFVLVATPTFAGQRDHGRPEGSAQQSTGRAVDRSQSRSGAVAPPAATRSERVSPQIDGRREVAVPRAVPRSEVVVPRAVPRNEVVVPRAVPRSEVVVTRGAYAPRYAPRYAPHYAPSYGYGIRGYSRPYVFRPRFSIGFGIFAGYPVPYAYSYPYRVPVYGYAAPRGPVMIGPGSSAYGGVALEITPNDAAVYVDGTYAGLVRDFDGSTQPLTLTGGTHRIDVEAQGFAPLTFDVGVQPGQVIPYRGDLQPQ